MIFGFRLAVLREIFKLTQLDLAKSLGVSQPTISQVEKAERPLTEALAEAACEAFDLPRSFFRVGPQIIDSQAPTFRKQSDVRVLDERRVVRLHREAARVFSRASQESGYKEVELPPDWSGAVAEDVAREVRSYLDLGDEAPIVNVTRVLERMGFGIVLDLDYAADVSSKHAGISVPTISESRPLISIASSMSADRARFTLAHELAHHIWDRGSAVRWTSTRAPEELRAHEFAGALLFPKKVAVDEISESLNLGGYVRLKSQYGISVSALIMRGKNLGILSPERVRSLQVQLSARGWKNLEPVEVKREKPLLFGQAMKRSAGLSAGAVEDFSSLPATWVFRWMEREPEVEPVVDLATWRQRRTG